MHRHMLLLPLLVALVRQQFPGAGKNAMQQARMQKLQLIGVCGGV
jgi:hypothetical protein